MGSYRDALMESLMGATTLDEAQRDTLSEEEMRERRADAATQRAGMDGYFQIAKLWVMVESTRKDPETRQPTVITPVQMQEMQEIRLSTPQQMRRTPSSQGSDSQDQISPAVMNTDPDSPETTDSASQKPSVDPQQPAPSQKPPIPNRRSNVLHRAFERGDPEHTIQRLKQHLREAESENHHLRNERGYIHHVYAAAKEETASIRRDFQDHIEKTRFSRQKMEEKCELIQKDNENLREYITSMSKAQEPIRGEDFYVQSFEELRGHIQSWMAKNSKLNAKEILAEGVQTEVVAFLDKCGPHGIITSKKFGSQIRDLWTSRRTRVPLLRHIVALFLFETVFDRFAFGHDRAASEYLKWIEGDLFRQDIEFTKILTIRQALGRAALQSQIHRPETVKRQETYKLNLTHILTHLLPKSNRQDIESAVSKWLEKAVALRNAMTEEQAIYRCFIPDTEEPYMEEIMEVADEQPAGRVLLCTFPGLDRLIFKDLKKVSVLVVKASVELREEEAPTPTEENQLPGE